MGRQVSSDAYLSQARAVQEQLASQGIDDQALEQIFSQPGRLDAILGDNRLLLQYFQIQARGLNALTSWDFDNPFMAGPNQIPSPNDRYYSAYFGRDRDPPGGVPGVDYPTEQEIWNPQWWVDNQVFTPQQADLWVQWMDLGLYGRASAEPGGASPGSTAVGTTPGAVRGSAGGPKIGALAYGGPKQLGASSSGGAPPTPPPGGGVAPGALGPAGGGMPVGGAGGDNPFYNWDVASYINSIQDPVARDMVMGVFGGEAEYNQLIYNEFGKINTQQSAIQQLQQFISGIDATTPEGQHQVMVANMQLGNLTNSVREGMDVIKTLKQRSDERKQYLKSILDTLWRTTESIIRNIGRSG